MEKHRTTREGDEYVCTCGRRWDIDEADPHPSTPAEHIADMRNKLKRGDDVSE